jgi:preprotein translocase subunit SecG
MHVLLIVLQVIISIVVVVSVLMQPSKQQGLSGLMMGGIQETFYSKNKARTREAMLAKVTVISSLAFAVVAILLNKF